MIHWSSKPTVYGETFILVSWLSTVHNLSEKVHRKFDHRKSSLNWYDSLCCNYYRNARQIIRFPFFTNFNKPTSLFPWWNYFRHLRICFCSTGPLLYQLRHASASKSEGNSNVLSSITMQKPHSVDRIYNSILPNVEWMWFSLKWVLLRGAAFFNSFHFQFPPYFDIIAIGRSKYLDNFVRFAHS